MIPTQGTRSPRRPKQAVSEASPARVVPKPVAQSQAKDPRTYQVEQIRRRFSPKETTLQSGDTSLVFKLAPSDPDFPFELEFLECDLRVPSQYPKQAAKLVVKNQDIPRGFAINIERGWDNLVKDRPGATLLALTNALDKALESFLSEQKTETVKLTVFRDTRHLDGQATANIEPKVVASQSRPAPAPATRRYAREPSFTADQIAEAKARRAQEVRQLEARMGREPMFHKSSDGIVYTLPIEVKRRNDLPVGLQPVKSVQLIIPLLYPLQALRVLLNDVESADAEGVEELFVEKAAEQRQMNLMSHLNYLASNMHLLARQASARDKKTGAVDVAAPKDATADVQAKEAEHTSTVDDAKSHVQVIPRPPEWSRGADDYGTDETDSEDYTDSDEDHHEEGGATVDHGQPAQSTAAHQTPERGIAITFPSLEMHGIELLQITSISLNIKCERCKTINELTGLKPDVEKQTTCKKCASPFAVKFRPEFMHSHSTRAGFLDAGGCTVADLLPSTFAPTCSNCSTQAAQGLTAVRGDRLTNICRACHAKFSLSLGPEAKFLPYSPGTVHLPTGPQRHKTERLGLHAGAPLPDNGACAHYRRSYRWFRFGCCGRVHPCDRCHDAAEGHENEWAPRMICGWCSREQRYDPEACAFCGRSVIGRKGSGYWEGGKGTRDKTLMRRGDRRKYKRVGGGERKK
ncbi:CHY zinc finger domain protein [Coniochaeta hoffmannii]|uniref:CHY zinc finger domain protein n=1 Tax=Coniochaeta hoffmannii TaxID=91930 RepID=A0AA38VQ89_9PEZI|nr:CHY zinc finger domain protein [Coniochaeta hoffmannii]